MDFPASPSLNQIYSLSGKTWTWNGKGWQRQVTTLSWGSIAGSLSSQADLQAALNGKIPIAQRAAANGVATLDADTKLPKAQLPALIRSDVGLGNVENTADLDKPISNLTAAALGQRLLNNTANPIVGIGVTGQDVNLEVSSPGIGYSSGIKFTRASDNAGIQVTELATDQTNYDFWISDNPDGADFFQWRMVDFQGINGTWTPLRMGQINSEYNASQHRFWGPILQQSALTGYFTTGNQTSTVTAGKYVPYYNDLTKLPAGTLSGTITITVLDISGYTANNGLAFWIRAASATTFDWGYGAPGATQTGTGIAFSASQITLSNGVKVTFNAATGAVAGDTWQARIYKPAANNLGPTTVNSLTVTTTLTVSGAITGASFVGSGASLTGLTKAQVGLANADNTADTAKPVSTAQQTALNDKVSIASTGIGKTGSVGFYSALSTPALWAALPVGFSSMIASTSNGVGLANGAPVDNYGYLHKVANRDSFSGWSALWVGYTAGENFLGRTADSSTFATWERIYTTVYKPNKTDVGLSAVDNTADSVKAVLSATKFTTARTINGISFDGTANITINAVDSTARIAATEKGAANGVATLGSDSKIPATQLPAIAITSRFLVASDAAQIALTAQEGDVAIRSDTHVTYIHNGGVAGTMADWSLLETPTDVVTSVAGMTGVVVLSKSDVGLNNVDNTSDSSKSVSSAAVLTTPRLINGVAFDGSGNITVSAATFTTPRLINGVSFDGSANITINAIDSTARIAFSEKGVAGGVATLDSNGQVPAAQLPATLGAGTTISEIVGTIGDGTATSFTITHGLNTRNVTVEVYRNSGSYETIVPSMVSRASLTTVVITFATAPTTGQFAYIIRGIQQSSRILTLNGKILTLNGNRLKLNS